MGFTINDPTAAFQYFTREMAYAADKAIKRGRAQGISENEIAAAVAKLGAVPPEQIQVLHEFDRKLDAIGSILAGERPKCSRALWQQLIRFCNVAPIEYRAAWRDKLQSAAARGRTELSDLEFNTLASWFLAIEWEGALDVLDLRQCWEPPFPDPFDWPDDL
jgi:hypothetical protein